MDVAIVTEASEEEVELELWGFVGAFSRGVVESEPFDGLIIVGADDETDSNDFLFSSFVSDPACTD